MFDGTSSSSWLTWSHPFENYPLSYHIYIENQHGQLLYNDITNDTSYELYNMIFKYRPMACICFIHFFNA